MGTTTRFSTDSLEGTLILACLRARYARGCNRAFPYTICDRVSWPKVLAIARRHGIVPLLYEALSENPFHIPEKTSAELKKQFYQDAINSFRYAAELVRLCGHLQRHGVRALPFKGPTLAALLYRKLSLRKIRDLDILVTKDQIDLALDVLKTCGYAPATAADHSNVSREGKHVLLADQSAGFQVELHWAIADPAFGFSLRFDLLWAERQNVTLLTHPIATVSRENLLLILGAHGTSHCWESLKWICDIAQAATVFPDLDWTSLLNNAHALGCKRMLLTGMALARNICEIELPQPVERNVNSDKRAIELCKEIQSRLFAPKRRLGYLERILTFIQSRERLRDRMHFICAELRPTERDRRVIDLPDSMRILYVPIRLVRVVLFHWRKAIVPLLCGVSSVSVRD